MSLLVAALGMAALAAPAPPPDARWQYQLEGRVDPDVCSAPLAGGACVRPTVFDIDLYAPDGRTLNGAAVAAIHARGGYAICYVNAGTAELFRPDWPRYRRWHLRHGRSLLGRPFSERFPDERWLNIEGDRGQRDFVLRMVDVRSRRCAQAGFDAVEYDVVNAWEEGRAVTGWRISARTQLRFNRALARIAHRHGLAAGLKNDLPQARALEPSFEFAVSESCFRYRECRPLEHFARRGKPVFVVEYGPARGRFCPQASRRGYQAIGKARDLSLRARPWLPCD